MNANTGEVDPLCNYDYSYGMYKQMPNIYIPPTSFIKQEPLRGISSDEINKESENFLHYMNLSRNSLNVNHAIQSNQTDPNIPNGQLIPSYPNAQNFNPNGQMPNENFQIKLPTQPTQDTEMPDVKPVIGLLNRKKGKGKTSSYWNKKVTEANFPFYGCTICNINFQTLNELDQHVTIHKGRLTSYDVRIRNQVKRKQMKKEKKKLKKMKKDVKKESVEEQLEIEIKPEDGYIGNETASEYQSKSIQNESKTHIASINPMGSEENTNVDNKNGLIKSGKELPETKDSKDKEDDKGKVLEKDDPRLEKLFKCFACGKQFALSYYLKLHVRSHTDEKPYTCSECGQSFITASKLGRHTKRIHLAIRYQCRICYRFFARFDFLTRHFDKKHPDDKLEGEPYDYNAILPYLKELEEQLRDKIETKPETTETVPADQKPKTEPWFEVTPHGTDTFYNYKESDMNAADQLDSKDHLGPECLDSKSKLEFIKEDVGSPPSEHEVYADDFSEDIKTEEIKMENLKDERGGDSASDEDYFPSNTWVSTPKPEVQLLSPPSKRRYKNSDYPLKCEFCEKSINSASYMRIHLRIHTGEKPYKCYICDRGFITSSKMHRHVLTHDEGWEGESEIKLEGDIKVEDKEGDEIVSKDDKVKLKLALKKNKVKLTKKMKFKDGPRVKGRSRRPFQCDFCQKRFLHKETLNVHQKSHDGEQRVFECRFCLQPMENEELLSEHVTQHTGPRPYVCTICGKTYSRRETMVYHRKNHDTGNPNKKEFICDICSKTFNAQCKLQRHIISHRSDKFVLRYECPVCAHMFNTKYHIRMHLQTHQKEGLILEENRNEILAMVMQNARKIPKKSDNTVNLTDLIPSDERSRICNICGQDFQHFYYLEEHLKSHGSKIAVEGEETDEEKKHVCQVCNKGFKLHYYLKLHSFTHTKEKPFICQQCGKGFITKGKLKRHLETHTGLKKYQCHICYKFFTRPSYMRIHIRTIHGTQDYNFRIDKNYMPMQHSV